MIDAFVELWNAGTLADQFLLGVSLIVGSVSALLTIWLFGSIAWHGAVERARELFPRSETVELQAWKRKRDAALLRGVQTVDASDEQAITEALGQMEHLR